MRPLTCDVPGLLREAVTREPAIGRILSQAWDTTYEVRSRADWYERYKRQLSRYMRLRTVAHYEAVLATLDRYLPEEAW